MSLSKCQAPGLLKSSNVSSVTFDTSSGIANFSNFYITESGMYVMLINVRSESGSVRTTCYSEPIVVKKAFKTLTIDTNSAPNLYLNFSGNYGQLSADQLKKLKTYFYNCLVLPYNLVTSDSVFVYRGSVIIATHMDSSTSAGSLQSMASYLQLSQFQSVFSDVSSDLTFNWASINNAVVNGKSNPNVQVVTSPGSATEVSSVTVYGATVVSNVLMNKSDADSTNSVFKLLETPILLFFSYFFFQSEF